MKNAIRSRGVRRFALSIAALVCLATPKLEAADETENKLTLSERFRGSSVDFRTGVTALTFVKRADPNYDPTVEMSLSVAPRFWFDDKFYASAGISISKELTAQNDVDEELSGTTVNREADFSDLSVRFGASRFYQIPVAKIDLSADVSFIAPTSKVSRARSLVVGFGPGLSLARSWDVLGGIRLGYSGRVTSLQHRYSTAGRQGATIDGPGTQAATSEFRNTGRRNVRWSTSHTGSIDVAFIDELSVNFTGGFIYNRLYKAAETDVDIAETESENVRRIATWDISITGNPTSWLALTLGTSSANPVRAANQDLRTPFVTRYSDVYLNIGFDLVPMFTAK